MLRTFVLAAAAVVGLAMPALALEPPEAFVEHVYAVQYPAGGADGVSILEAAQVGRYFSKAVAAAIKADDEKSTKAGEIGAIDFDLSSDSQDPQVSDVKLTRRSADAKKAVVDVSFSNGPSVRVALVYDLVVQGGAWRIADIRKEKADEGWSLRDLLNLPPLP